MSRLDELMEELCPRGVEFREMGEVGTFVRGSGLQKKDFVKEGIGCIHYGQIYTYYKTSADKTKSFVSPALARQLKKVEPGDLIIASTSENIEDVCKTVAWVGAEEIVTGGHATIFKHSQNPKYLAYLTQTDFFFHQKLKFAKGTKVIDISARDLAKIVLPIPPLEIQSEIVRTLDMFVELKEALELELQRELEARRKQFVFYRNQLLNFEKIHIDRGGGHLYMTLVFSYGVVGYRKKISLQKAWDVSTTDKSIRTTACLRKRPSHLYPWN